MILDTNAVSAMADGDSLIEPLLRSAEELALPVIVLGEYRYGIRQSRHRADYEQWLEELILSCRILDVDPETTEHYAALRVDLKQLGQPAQDAGDQPQRPFRRRSPSETRRLVSANPTVRGWAYRFPR